MYRVEVAPWDLRPLGKELISAWTLWGQLGSGLGRQSEGPAAVWDQLGALDRLLGAARAVNLSYVSALRRKELGV